MANKITVMGVDITHRRFGDKDFLSLTDIAKFKTDAPDRVIATWMRIYNTISYLGTWETINNPNFKPHIYEGFKIESAENNFWLSPKKWVENTNAIGMFSKSGNNGGTFAHKDIAFKFASWLSVEFELYMIQEFQRLKKQEIAQIEWDAKRELARLYYHVHTKSIKDNLIPTLQPHQITYVYQDEADILNVALFGLRASEWKKANPTLQGNQRDHANVHQLLVMSSMESYNAQMIKEGLLATERIKRLNDMARYQLPILIQANSTLLIEDKE